MATKHVKKVHNKRFTIMDALLLVLLTLLKVLLTLLLVLQKMRKTQLRKQLSNQNKKNILSLKN